MNSRIPASSTPIETPEQIVEHLRALIAEVERSLVVNSASAADDQQRLASLKARLASLKEKAAACVGSAKERLGDGARQADTAIRAHPYESLAVALGVGLLVGILLRRGTAGAAA